MKVSRVSEMRDLDRRATTEYGIAPEILMENAGQASYFTILKEFGVKDKNFVFFCGVGNNGGDGLVAARKIHSSGGKVTVFIVGDRSKFKGSAKQNFDIVDKFPIKIMDFKDINSAQEAVQNSDAIIDAIFGTGLDREVGMEYKDVINLINTSQKTVFSIDIPSGVHGDTGQIMGTAVKAHYTITFGLPKIGNLLYPGFELCGKLYVTHISFPSNFQDSDQLKIATNDPKPISPRDKDSHKGDYGKVLFIAGSSNYLGAPYFAALSFLRAGGGLSFLATPENISAFIGNKGSEIVFVPQKSTSSGSISIENKQNILQFSENVDMVVIGPGLSLNEETQTLVRELSAEINKPLLIDGDGITAIANDLDIIKKRKLPTVLTPHLGEMVRITRQKSDDIKKNKIDILQSTAHELNAIIVLKGAHSLIGYPDKRVLINLSGNPGMATAGSGDVLTGTIAAMFGLGFSINDAVGMGVFMHGFAGDLAAKDRGEDGLIASDIMDHLPASMRMYREDYHSIVENYYYSIQVV
ncbi:MAG: bifunctional ADP-dependent NAD(P)H-hydrate dehydratase/NAD(P)H-hydrate epimerase [Candidatus Marinimicrobia bacterium CG08_land_8_20_14_0_20_45_22]|nr:MAG: bifunctional ADP-dependent NAD(P)H-hydrate dehydratase/NAD(P)H-hydrate epimerase [Candidatus Marinimicrobia bacterium CG08_land_8_20_14_0_20_45_22]